MHIIKVLHYSTITLKIMDMKDKPDSSDSFNPSTQKAQAGGSQ